MNNQETWYKLIVVFSEVVTIGGNIKTQPMPFERNKQCFSLGEAKAEANAWAQSIAVTQGYEQKPYIEAFQIPITTLLLADGVKEEELDEVKQRIFTEARVMLNEHEKGPFWGRTVLSQTGPDAKIKTAVIIMTALLKSDSKTYLELKDFYSTKAEAFAEMVKLTLEGMFTEKYSQAASANN